MAKRKAVKKSVRKPKGGGRTGPSPGYCASTEIRVSPGEARSIRDLFWQNVMREVLVSLATLSARRHDAPSPAPGAPDAAQALDGRLGIITSTGMRIPVAAVYPVFAATIPKSAEDRALSSAVECTVFQIHTPKGEVYTMPLQNIRGFHSLSEQLLEQLQEGSRGEGAEGEVREPFGFAAFTSLARSSLPGHVHADDLSGAL